ncbi:glycosyltransferase family 2 protein [Methylomonas sp. MK1]|uniref:glycosyltransferase family 2 protein n=1 Tax=Methylomonas sp. MK1 TaxID=1131552 RepID=UPI00036DBC19|nr:glycosyltransferase [Methylomonas sp. MK1]
MNNPPLISIIIPVYNSEKYLEEALQSALSQTYNNIEIIAVNDGSTDSSQDILKKYADSIKILSQPNLGASAARNLGVSVSSGDILAFLDSDDIWDKNKLERQLEVLENHPEAIGLYSDVRYIDAQGNLIKATDAYRTGWCSGNILEPLLFGKGVFGFSPSLVIIRRKNFELAGGFPEDVRQYEDYGLWLKLSLQGPFLYLIDTLSSYRRHPASLTASKQVHEEQLYGQYRALLSCKSQLENHEKLSTRTLYFNELYECSKSLGWWARIRGNTALSIEAYKNALAIKPSDLNTLARLLWVLLISRIKS